MKTLDRYVAGIFVRNLIMSIFAMALLFLFQAIFSDIYDHAYLPHQIILYNLMNLPRIVVEMTPPSVLLATLLTLSGLTRTQEIVAWYSLGLSLKRLLAIILLIIGLVTCLILIMEDRILPPAFQRRINYYWREMKKHPDFFLDIKRDKVWYRAKSMIYNLQRFDNTSETIHGMSLYTFDDHFDLIQVIGAEKAEYTAQGWKLINGTVTVFSQTDTFPLTREFTEKQVLIAESPRDFQEIEKEVDGLRFKDLYRYIQRTKGAGADTRSYEVKFHSRISLAFVPVVMCFLAIPFSLRSRREGGIAKDLGLCLIFTFFYWVFYSVGLSLGTKGVLSPWLGAWLPSIVFMGLATILIARKSS